MNKFVKVAAVVAVAACSQAALGMVHGYVKKNGTYVAPHARSAPNNTKIDNYSSKGNVNPYTGKKGTVDPYKGTPNKSYRSPYNTRSK